MHLAATQRRVEIALIIRCNIIIEIVYIYVYIDRYICVCVCVFVCHVSVDDISQSVVPIMHIL